MLCIFTNFIGPPFRTTPDNRKEQALGKSACPLF
jgi:hypothetical protein